MPGAALTIHAMRPDLPDALRRALAAGDPHEVTALVALGATCTTATPTATTH
jgi:hypothetical protein